MDAHLDDLQKQTGDNTQKLREVLDEARRHASPEIRKKVTSESLSDTLRILTKTQIDNFMRGRSALSVVGFAALVKYLWDEKLWSAPSIEEQLSERPAALFHGLANFLNAGAQTRINLRAEIPGIYRVWRPSMHWPGEYLLGKMKIEADTQTRAVRATEYQVYKGRKFEAEHRETFDGYIVKKSRYFMIIARQQPRHKGAPRVTMLHNALYDNGIVQAMQGIVTGCYGSNQMFSAPVYFERVAGDDVTSLDSELDVVLDAPLSIKVKLKLRIEDNVLRF